MKRAYWVGRVIEPMWGDYVYIPRAYDIRTELNKFKEHAASAIGHGAGTTDGDETLRFLVA